MNHTSPSPDNNQDRQQAEQLEGYLQNLESGRLDVPAEADLALLAFARNFKVAARSLSPTASLLQPDAIVFPVKSARRRAAWFWLTPLPVVGLGVIGLWFWSKPTTAPITESTAALAQIAIADDLAAVNQLDADLAVITADLDRSLREIDALTGEDLSAL